MTLFAVEHKARMNMENTNQQLNIWSIVLKIIKYQAQSTNVWIYHVQFSVVTVDHKQYLGADHSQRWT